MTSTKKHFWPIAKIIWIIFGIFLLSISTFSYFYLYGMRNLGDLIIRTIFLSYSLAGLLIYLFISLIFIIIWLIKRIIRKLK